MKNILILDDDEQIVEALGIILKTAGYKVIQETDGQGIEEKVLQLRPDLMIIDIRLADANGLEITHNLKNNPKTKDIPVILMSARVGNLSKDQLEGANMWMPKPFRMRELLENITSLLAHSSPP